VRGTQKFRIGVLGSGKGSNFAAIADACAVGSIPAEVAIVLSDLADARILERAREQSRPAQFIAPGNFRDTITTAETWSTETCRAYARSIGANNWQLACMNKDVLDRFYWPLMLIGNIHRNPLVELLNGCNDR